MIRYDEYIERDLFIPQLETLKKRKLCDNIICFDIETCNYFVYQGNVYSINEIIALCNYDVKKIEKFFDEAQAGAVPYIWQFCIDGTCVYGREFRDAKKIFNYLNKKVRGHETHIWIHNLSFEYQYLQEILEFEDPFFTDARKPLYAKYKDLYFRCSYRLTNLSLAKWGSNLQIEKKTGQLDYFGLYTPKTDLTAENLEYCEFDVVIMYFGIQQYLKIYKHVAYIPMTQTGIPRRDIKAENQKTRGFLKKVASMQPRTPDEWKVQHMTYSGGLVLCNPVNVGKVLRGVGSYDKKSAYPFAMLEKYPSTHFEKSTGDPDFNDGLHHIVLVEFIDFNAKYTITPVSSSKRILLQGVVFAKDNPAENQRAGIKRNNGKIIHADRYVCYATEVDMKLINMYYTAKKTIIHSHYVALSDYMPRHVILYMLERYKQKTLLTGIDDTMRMREKEKLNSLYGMCGTALIHDTIKELDDFTYEKTRLDDRQIQSELDKLHQKMFKNVLPYSWGVYITTYQRYFLMEMMSKFIVNGRLDKICYTDTDCLKGLFDEHDAAIFDAENARIIEWTKDRCKAQDIPYEMTCPANTSGAREYLGIWEHDAQYAEIKFIRAKCYAYKEIKEKNGKQTITDTKITIAGVPKAAAHVLQSVDDLQEGLEFDLFNSHKSLLTYRDGDNPLVTMPDGYKVKNTCAVNIRPTSYKLTLESEYRELIKKYITEKHH